MAILMRLLKILFTAHLSDTVILSTLGCEGLCSPRARTQASVEQYVTVIHISLGVSAHGSSSHIDAPWLLTTLCILSGLQAFIKLSPTLPPPPPRKAYSLCSFLPS